MMRDGLCPVWMGDDEIAEPWQRFSQSVPEIGAGAETMNAG
jgi:hypothetical protein